MAIRLASSLSRFSDTGEKGVRHLLAAARTHSYLSGVRRITACGDLPRYRDASLPKESCVQAGGFRTITYDLRSRAAERAYAPIRRRGCQRVRAALQAARAAPLSLLPALGSASYRCGRPPAGNVSEATSRPSDIPSRCQHATLGVCNRALRLVGSLALLATASGVCRGSDRCGREGRAAGP